MPSPGDVPPVPDPFRVWQTPGTKSEEGWHRFIGKVELTQPEYLMIPTCLGEYESFGENLKLGEDSRAMTKCGAQYSQTWEGINLFFNEGGMEK